ncbi:hypothetical protein, partial [Thermogutta sp.]|uniref:hypothetical protein n=1 Tax=Thermogutta sp. TaxID=1962930 RepID=UPI00321FEF4A
YEPAANTSQGADGLTVTFQRFASAWAQAAFVADGFELPEEHRNPSPPPSPARGEGVVYPPSHVDGKGSSSSRRSPVNGLT